MQHDKATLEQTVVTHLKQGDFSTASRHCEALLQAFPEYDKGWYLAYMIAGRQRQLTKALEYIDRAISLSPDTFQWKIEKVNCLESMKNREAAIALALAINASKLVGAREYSTLGIILSRLGLHQEALGNYQAAADLEPNKGGHFYNLATTQRFLGQLDDCEKSLAIAIKFNPLDYEAHKILSDLRKCTPEKNHVPQLKSVLNRKELDPKGRVHICFALAKELEDMGEHQESFQFLKQGADLRRAHMRYNVDGELDTIAAIQSTYQRPLFESGIKGYNNRDAIFILGLPRTGTTLTERVLGSHSQVTSAGELNNFALEMTRLARQSVPADQKVTKQELVALSSKMDFEVLGKAYIDSTTSFKGDASHFIDKLPLNYLYTGLIHLALPNAKIINIKRHPVDTCYAIYKQLFKDAYPFSYQLEELGRYYVAYHQLMDHWNQVMPGVIHTVHYEDMVRDTDGEARKLIEFCDLPWEDQCIRFYENKQASTTASATQVRQRAYTTSVGKWKRYEKELKPLLDILERADIPVD